jgi:hypothetical protein
LRGSFKKVSILSPLIFESLGLSGLQTAQHRGTRSMRTSGKSESELAKAATGEPLEPGWYDAIISSALDTKAKSGREMMVLENIVSDAAGEERTLTDYLTDSTLCGLRLRHAAVAVGAEAKFDALSIGQDDFAGRRVRILVGVEKKRGFRPRNVCLDYAAPNSVVNLRSA